MPCVFDSTFLVLLTNPDAPPPLDPATDAPVELAKERIEHLIKTLSEGGDKIIVPTPVLSEFLVRADEAAADYLQILDKSSAFQIENFDQRAAVELAALNREALDTGDKRTGTDAPWSKVKFDRQIVAIAKVARADCIYSDDDDLKTFSTNAGIRVIKLHEIDLPPEERQGSLILDDG